MNILLVIKNTANLRTLAPVVRLLAERGHEVRIACRDVKSPESQAQMSDLVAGSERITVVEHPFIRQSGWSDLAGPLRRTIDYLRYLEPVYRESPKLRARAESEAPPAGRRLGGVVRPVPGGPAASRRVLQGVERCIDPPPRALAFLRDERPDVLLITPLIGFGTYQADLVRAAKRLGIPVSFPVRSWDNLTNKGLLRDAPDQVLVWNDLQKREAVDLHGVPPASVVVTGAPAYDHWFDWQPSRSREELAAAAGLDPGCPIVLYVGSSEFIAPDEPAFVRRWVEAVRAHGGSSAGAGLLVRPHPLAATGFRDLRIDDPQVAIWPAHGEFPLAGEARQNYFDSIFHSDGRHRHQHQRADRGGDRRPARVHDPRPRVRRYPGRNAPLPLPGRRPVRPSARGGDARGACGAAAAGRRRRGAGRPERALPAPVRPSVRAGRAGDRPSGRRDRGARLARAVAGRRAGRRPARPCAWRSSRWRNARRPSGAGRSRRAPACSPRPS